ncbi:S-adenosyl-L-methionine-dependent methyltransferase [Microdochium trichocladiopsis]|uniref:tRNA (guanine(26)-N(2))-dimethyltransferase n=1 Tax=Microdochium trichocladiopsis TaxID=1682393 RepID=A0A9P8Y6F5_9PEZI|nr:S-adenosyl-L-methionine-dependent methyltransferase [Microdochium trichocladiopsis]KAH7031134.1 S-adenosyl-L-methionine-dependent methyltransferase [Microdochium trichocladiopsis]
MRTALLAITRTAKPRNVAVSRPFAFTFEHCTLCTMSTKPNKKPAAAAPATDIKIVTRDGKEFREIQEGLGRILVPFSASEAKGKSVKQIDEQQKVFYNPIQQFNRDLTVLAIKAYGEDVVKSRKAAMEKRILKGSQKRKRDKSDIGEGRPAKHDGGSTAAPSEQEQATNGGDAVMSETHAAEHGSQETAADRKDAMDDAQERPAEQPTEPTKQVQAIEDQNGHELEAELQKPGNSGGRQLKEPNFTILDALSATGLRAMRYAQELPFVTSVTANDLIADAVEAIKRNAEHNGVASKVTATQGDARAHMYNLVAEELAREHKDNPRGLKTLSLTPSKRYDVIDLDPYGTAATFLDAAVNAVRDDGGLLCVTCTDSGVWASHGYSEKAFALYGGIPIKGHFSHEGGLRLILHALATTAARHGLAIEPQLSLSIDYYIRIFVKVYKSPASVKFLAGKTMVVYSCDQGCGAWQTQLLLRNRKQMNKNGQGTFYKHGLSLGPTVDTHCEHCKTKMHMGGPMYAGPLHNAAFIKKILDDLPQASTDIYGTTARIEGMLSTALEELSLPEPKDELPRSKEDALAALDHYPFYFHVSALAGIIHCMCPDDESFKGALRGLGYEDTRSHCKAGSIKTNAPWSVVWHVMREWVRQKSPVKLANIKQGTAAWNLLKLDQDNSGEPNGVGQDKAVGDKQVVFDKTLGRDRSRKGLVRYPVNPRENWGPMARASGH